MVIDQYTANLQKKLLHLRDQGTPINEIAKGSMVERRCVMRVIKGFGINYETGMKIKKYLREKENESAKTSV